MTETNKKENPSTRLTAKHRVSVSALIGLIAGGLVGAIGAWYFAPLIAWDIAALVFLMWIWSDIWPMDGHRTQQWAAREDPTRTAAEAVLITASVASLLAVGLVLVRAGGFGSLINTLQIALSVASVVLSWAVVHTVYTLNYARLYYSSPMGGVDFKESGLPAYTDFAYLAFTIGMTFQVSDTDLQSKQFRRAALHHALLSYLFGTVIVATTINLVVSLSK